jgi:hypothetical protein
MEWGRLYANLTDDPRVQAAEADGAAGFLLFESIGYCTRAETGGFIPHTQIERFGGGKTKRVKIAALIRERIWLKVEGGYTLNPDLWTEERNLSDQAEKKKEKDRNRINAKRAAQRAEREREAQDRDRAPLNGHESRDSRATCRATLDATCSATDPATCRCDSRSVEKRREEIDKSVVDHLQVGDGPVSRDTDDDDLVSAVVGAVVERTGLVLPDADARAVAARVLARAARGGVTVQRPPRYVAAAIAEEPDLYAELLAIPAPGGAASGRASPLAVPPCGGCDPRTRMREDADGRPFHCPECHPAALSALPAERGA